MRHTRPRLLTILGAGSTIHAGAPKTEDITDLGYKIEEEPISSVVSALGDQRTVGNFRNFDFETVLAALEELDEFNVRQRVPAAWPRVRGHLSAFAEFFPDFAKAVREKSFLVARTLLVVIIRNYVIERT